MTLANGIVVSPNCQVLLLQEAIRNKPGSSFSSTDLVISLASWSPQKSSPSVLAPPDATMHRNNWTSPPLSGLWGVLIQMVKSASASKPKCEGMWTRRRCPTPRGDRKTLRKTRTRKDCRCLEWCPQKNMWFLSHTSLQVEYALQLWMQDKAAHSCQSFAPIAQYLFQIHIAIHLRVRSNGPTQINKSFCVDILRLWLQPIHLSARFDPRRTALDGHGTVYMTWVTRRTNHVSVYLSKDNLGRYANILCDRMHYIPFVLKMCTSQGSQHLASLNNLLKEAIGAELGIF